MRRERGRSSGLWRKLFPGVPEGDIRPRLEDVMIANDPEDHDESGLSQEVAMENLRTAIGGQTDNILDRIRYEEDN